MTTHILFFSRTACSLEVNEIVLGYIAHCLIQVLLFCGLIQQEAGRGWTKLFQRGALQCRDSSDRMAAATRQMY